MFDLLNKARLYEKEKGSKIPDGQKPVFHVSAPVGWINDPNGFSEYKGEYHLFYQYHPYSPQWGPMHWGHSKTHDFVKWEQLPAALAPDQEYDKGGCFSGTAIEYQGKHLLFYTGTSEITLADGTREIRQAQCMAIGDGEEYQKSAGNPIICGDILPKGSRSDFRDPKVWKEGETFFLIAGSINEQQGQLPLFSSRDMQNWSFHSILAEDDGTFGRMWECPDFFQMDEKWVLLISPQDMQAKGLEYHNGNGTVYFSGQYDEASHGFVREQDGAIDYGLDFYAPQTLQSRDGRRIMIAWMQSWDNYMKPDDFQWYGMMTIPRELSLREGRLYQLPVREIADYYTAETHYEDVVLNRERKYLPGVSGRTLDLTVDIKGGDFRNFSIFLAQDERHYTQVIYSREAGTVVFDRNYAGQCRDMIHSRSMLVRSRKGHLKLRILLDYYSVEIFANDGEQAMTSLIYTHPSAVGIEFEADGTALFSVDKYRIEV